MYINQQIPQNLLLSPIFINEYMKKRKSPYLNDSKTFESITKFQLVPPNVIVKESCGFSAFSKNKLKKHHINQAQQSRNHRLDHVINEIKLNQNHSRKSLLLGRSQINNNYLEGVLRARKSHIKKIKLKQFYLEEFQQGRTELNDFSSHEGIAIGQKDSTEFNTIQSKQILNSSNNVPLTQKKKILPVRLRVSSYSNIQKSAKDRTIDSIGDDNIPLIRSKKNMSFKYVQKIFETNQQTNQKEFYFNPRRILSVENRKNRPKLQNQRSILGDFSMKNNEISENTLSQKDSNNQGYHKHKKGVKSQLYSKVNQSIFQIKGWGNNQDDKENEFFFL